MKTYLTMRSRVIRILMRSSLDRTSAEGIAATMHISVSTLGRRLRFEQTSYQTLLDAVRQHRCERSLARHWVPGKSLARDLGFREPNSFYRAFNKWTGKSYTQYKKELRSGLVQGR